MIVSQFDGESEEEQSKPINQYIFKTLSIGFDEFNYQQTKLREGRYLKFIELNDKKNNIQHRGLYYQVEKSEIIRINSLEDPIPVEIKIKNTDNKNRLVIDEIEILDQSGSIVWGEKINQGLEKCKKMPYSTKLMAKILKLVVLNKRLKSKDIKYSNLTINILKSMVNKVSKYREDAKKCILKININLKISYFKNIEFNTGDYLSIPVLVKLTCNGENKTLIYNYVVYHGSSLMIQDCLGKTWYPGDQHVHSNHSWDGKNTITEMSGRARKIGFAYLIITDHSHSIKDDWNEIREECIQNTDQRFICIRGVEISCDAFNRPSGGHDFDSSHLLAYNISKSIRSKGPIYDIWPDIPDPQDAVDFVHRQEGGFCFAAHPSGTKVMGYRWNEWNNPPDGMVVWSYVHDGDKKPKDETLKRWQELLNKSKIIKGIGDSDAHSIEELGHVWTWVLSDSLGSEGIQDSLAHGKSVFSNGPFSAFYINDGIKWHSIGSSISMPPDNKVKMLITWESHEEFGALDKINILINGETIYTLHPNERNGYKGWELLEVTVVASQDAIWRIEARTKMGKLCYSNPIWLRID